MKEIFLKTISRFLGWAALGSIFAFAILMANIEIKDLDLWLHLAMGKFIVQNGYVPQVDVLSFTISGRPWINHEWLFQIIVHQLFSRWGIDGLITMQVGLVTVTLVVLLFLGYDREKQWISLFPLLLVAFIFKERFTHRPDLFSLLFLAIYLLLLTRYRSKKWLPVALFSVQVLWVNIHGFFILGPILISLWLVGEHLNARLGRATLKPKETAPLKRSLIAVIIACFFNPMGIKGAFFPLKIFGGVFNESKIFFKYIGELESPFSWHSFLYSGEYLSLKLLILFSAVLLLVNYKRLNVRDLLLWGVFLFLSLSARRNVVFFSFIAYWVIVDYIPRAGFKFKAFRLEASPAFKTIAECVVKVCIVIFIFLTWQKVSLNGYFDFDRYERKSEFGGVSLLNFPHKAVDFLVENKIKGNFYNDFNSGAYLLGRTFPDIKVAIDGRTELYGSAFFQEHDAIWKGDAGLFKAWTDRYAITGVILGSVYGRIPQDTLLHLSQNKDWVLVYFDFDGVVFLKNTDENKEIIKKYAVALDEWRAPKLDLERIGVRKVEPYQHVSRAFSLASMQKYDQALEEGFEALRVWPNEQGAYKVIGYSFLKKDLLDEAFQTLRIAKLLNPFDKEVRYSLAMVYEKKKDFTKAIEHIQPVLQDANGRTLGLFFLARVYAKTEKFAQSVQALKTLGHSQRIIPAHADDIIQIGDMIYDKGQYRYAFEAYQTALATQKEADKVYHKMGLCHQKLGNTAEAKTYFQKSLSINQNYKEAEKSLELLK